MSLSLQIYRGRSTTYQIDVQRDGAALSLDGQTLIFTASRLQDAPASEAAIRKVSAESITHSPTVVGRAFFTISPSEADRLDPLVVYYCGVALVDAAGNPLSVDGLEGTLAPLSITTVV